jgi:hypothetical protein
MTRLPAVRDLFPHDVDGNLHQHRTRPTVLDLRERPAHRVRHRLREHHLLGPFGHVLIVEEGAEVRRDVEQLARVASGQHDDRDRVAERLRHAAEGVLGAGAVLHGEHADAVAGGHAADGVGHVEARAFLTDDDGADVDLGRRLDDLVDGIADEELHAFTLENIGDDRGCLHAGPPQRDVGARA